MELEFREERGIYVDVRENWCQHIPDPVIDSPEVTIIWDTQVHTDRTVTANKEDVILKDKSLNSVPSERRSNTIRLQSYAKRRREIS